jgi:hypothetical protein
MFEANGEWMQCACSIALHPLSPWRRFAAAPAAPVVVDSPFTFDPKNGEGLSVEPRRDRKTLKKSA